MESYHKLMDKSKEKVFFTVPKPIDCFSVNINREFEYNFNKLKYFVYPKSDLDLNDGFEKFIKKPKSAKHEKINHLLQYILHNPTLLDSEGKVLNTDFVCFRGLLSLIMRSPFSKDNWTFCAVKWRGTIYLCEFDKSEVSYDKADLFNYYGHKFEHYTLFESPDQTCPKDEPVNECEEFCVLYKSQLKDIKLFYGAEVDGIISNEVQTSKDFLKTANFVEIKTNKEIENDTQDYRYRRYKLLKFWSQSHLVGIRRIMVGYRTEDGILKKVLPVNVEDIPKKCGGLWSSEVCLKFLYEILALVKTVVNSNSSSEIWKFDWDSKKKLISFDLTDGAQYKILPDWYLQEVELHSRQL